MKNIGIAVVTLSVPGAELVAEEKVGSTMDLDTSDLGYETDAAIRSILLQAYADKIKYRHKNGVNTIKIIVGLVERQLAMLT